MPKQVDILPPAALLRGPDVLRGADAIAFVLTPYKNDEGENFFYRERGLGHEHWITEPEIVQGMFGPKLHQQSPDVAALGEKVKSGNARAYEIKDYEDKKDRTLNDELLVRSEIYEKNPSGVGYVGTGKYEEKYGWEPVRKWSRGSSLFGRYGKLHGKEVVMLWPPHKGWEERVPELLDKLNASDDAIVTVGAESQFLAKDFREGGSKKKNSSASTS